MEKRWTILSANETKVNSLKEALNINYTICSILVQRGIDNYNTAKQFFRPQLSDLYSPWLMKDMDKAVERIIHAFNNNQKILVYGDYDVDGTTSVASMFQFLRSAHPLVDYYIPHRYREGYGVSKQGIDFAAENEFSLIITLDCGIKSADLIDYANTLNIDVIVCDHHMPDDCIPKAVAILNPKQKDCNYPFKELCGCGVGFKLMMALAEKLSLPDESYLQYIDLVATAIAADIVPIVDENRILTYFGLKKVNSDPNPGIKALMRLSSVQTEMHVTNLVFIIAPRINAAGRMDCAKKAVQLFIEKDENAALSVAEQLHSDNTDRREADASITLEAFEMIGNDELAKNKKTTVVYQEHWHKGVVGIVASRLIDTYYRPTVVLTKSGDFIAGSARSVTGFNLYEAIHACRKHLIGYGGHFAAAGLTMLPENLDNFINQFEEVVSSTITEELLTPEIVIDSEITLDLLNNPFYNILEQMEPFGPENMRPVFISRNVYNKGSKIVKDKHIRFVVGQNNKTITGIGFNMADKFELLTQRKLIDIVYTVEINEWNGNKELQIKMIDFRLSMDNN